MQALKSIPIEDIYEIGYIFEFDKVFEKFGLLKYIFTFILSINKEKSFFLNNVLYILKAFFKSYLRIEYINLIIILIILL